MEESFLDWHENRARHRRNRREIFFMDSVLAMVPKNTTKCTGPATPQNPLTDF
jgi:hypothetical protein